ncbi:MAG: hypothetical protein Q9184_008378, partial [Pyrenodesmia sp. 2 TL-2023]
RKRAASAAAAANPIPEPTPAPAADPAPANPAPDGNPESKDPKPEEAAKPTEDAKPAEAPAKAPFTPAEDVALLSLKAQNKTWKEIHEVLVERDFDELKSRFKEIGPTKGGQGGEASKEGPVAGAAKGNKQQKGDGGKKGKGKQEEAKTEETKDEPVVAADADAAAPAPAPIPPLVNPNEAVVADRKDAQIKGILRRGSDGAFQFGEAVVPDGATTINGCPIIYLDENDPLDIEELSYLYNMNCAFEEQRWIRLASKFFDQTGKRVEPEWLKEKLKNCTL